MDFGSSFPAGSQARIRTSLGLDTLFNSKLNIGTGISGDATASQFRPWTIKRTATATTYQYMDQSTLGVIDDSLGFIWHFDFSSQIFYLAGRRAWTEANFNPNTKTGKFSGTITGDGTKTSFDVTHNLNTTDFTFNVKDSSGYSSLVDVIPKDANTATVVMGTALASSDTRKVVIIG